VISKAYSLTEITAFVIAITPIAIGLMNFILLIFINWTTNLTHHLVNSRTDALDAKVANLTELLSAERASFLVSTQKSAATIAGLQQEKINLP
jgi:hypothetical protein